MTLRKPNRMDAKMQPMGLPLARMAMPMPNEPMEVLKFCSSICWTPLTSVKPASPASPPAMKKAVT